MKASTVIGRIGNEFSAVEEEIQGMFEIEDEENAEAEKEGNTGVSLDAEVSPAD